MGRSEVAFGSDPRAGRVGSGVLFALAFFVCIDRSIDRSIVSKNAGSEMRILFVACGEDAV